MKQLITSMWKQQWKATFLANFRRNLRTGMRVVVEGYPDVPTIITNMRTYSFGVPEVLINNQDWHKVTQIYPIDFLT